MKGISENEFLFDGEVAENVDQLLGSLADYDQVQMLTGHNLGIEDCVCISPFRRLRMLDLSFNSLKTFQGMPALLDLHTLLVAHNKLKDIVTLPAIPGLQILSLSDNPINSIAGIDMFTELRTLYLRKTQLSDLNPLVMLKKLDSLFVSIQSWGMLAPIENQISITRLYVQGKTIYKLEGMPQLPNLRELTVTQSQALNSVNDPSPLRMVTHLTLSYNAIEDFSFCYTLPNLQYLDVRGNPGAGRLNRERLSHISVVHT